MRPHRIVLALGSNLGDSEAIFADAIEEVARFVTLIRTSSYYRSVPVGGPPQPDYLNAVLIGETELAQDELLARLQAIEAHHGRLRTERWGARTLDLDLIDFDSTPWHSERLTLPHPRAHERAFVLLPWVEVDPEAVLIGYGPVNSLLVTVDSSGVVRK